MINKEYFVLLIYF